MRRLASFLLLGLLALTTVTACSTADAAPTVDTTGATVIDVRTPAEFAEGHLEGAVNIDVSAPGFDAAVGELDPAGSYVVYCRSGNRSAAAAARMADLGFGDVTDVGGLQEAADATGLPVVTD